MKLTKEMLIDWIDRPPSNEDLDLIAKILNLQIELEVTNEIITMNINRINKLEKENQQLKKQKDEVVEIINLINEIAENRVIPNCLYKINIGGYNLLIKFLYFDLVIVSYTYSGECNYLKIKENESLFKYFPVLAILHYKVEKVGEIE